jgi:probable HAF family extracellular repeat protein
MVGLGDLPGGAVRSFATAMTPDGAVIVGYSESGSGVEAFRWTADEGMTGLGDLPGGQFRSLAVAVSADGSTILCASDTDRGEEYAIWTREEGMQNLRARLIDLGAKEADAWFLSGHYGGISADGRIVAGYGTNPSGHREAWIASIARP